MNIIQELNNEISIKNLTVNGTVYILKDIILIDEKDINTHLNNFEYTNDEIVIDGDLFIKGNVRCKDVHHHYLLNNIKYDRNKPKTPYNGTTMNCENFIILNDFKIKNDVIFYDPHLFKRIRMKKIKKIIYNLDY
jgi:hypothetical protein